jgi:O-antigen ligase
MILKGSLSFSEKSREWLSALFDFGAGDYQLCQRIALIGVCFLPISIGGMQIFLGLAGTCWIFITIQKKKSILFPPFFPCLVFFFIFSVISLIFSLDPSAGLTVFKTLPIILIPLMFYNIITDERQKKKMLNIFYAGAALNSAWGLIMYAVGNQHRLSGFLGHYMTAAGILMMIIIFLFGHMLTAGIRKFGKTRMLLLLFFIAAFMLTLTRNAWVGGALGLMILFGIIRPKYVPLGLVILFLFFIFLPPVIKERIASTFDIHDSTIQDRLMMIRTGTRIIKANPVWGVGPEMVPRVYEEYKVDEADQKRPHLHNNIFQIAAERGLVTVFCWMVFLGSVLYHGGKLYNRERQKEKDNSYIPQDFMMISCVVTVISFLTAGLFEYNWGDTEVACAFLFLITLPFTTYKKEFKLRLRAWWK